MKSQILAVLFALFATTSASKMLFLGLEDEGFHDDVCAGQTVGAVLVDKDSCDSYIECSSTGPVSVLCPESQAFNDKTMMCDDEINVKCARGYSSCGGGGCKTSCCRPQKCGCSTKTYKLIKTCKCKVKKCPCKPKRKPCCKCCPKRRCSCKKVVKCCKVVSWGGSSSSSSGGWGGSSSSSGGWGGSSSSSSGGCSGSNCGSGGSSSSSSGGWGGSSSSSSGGSGSSSSGGWGGSSSSGGYY